ncbi:MAG: fumarate hydratase [Candidatus Hodarchaeaceae archaeon]|nr:fumarate hydratase [Candidatus Hodarchaeaceae archaeon]
MLKKADFRDVVVEMLRRAETNLPDDVLRVLRRSGKRERSPIAKLHFELMMKNLELAKKFWAPICQDTGTFTFFVQFGRGLKLNFDLEKTIGEAVALATREVPLRPSVVDPITRKPAKPNTGRGQPAVHIELVGGKRLQVDLLVKGAGTENWGRLFMLRPVEGPRAIERAVLLTLTEAWGRPCPPTVVGVGVGGSMETAPLLAKRALLRPLDRQNPDPTLAKLERQIERAANRTGIGPMGLGGETTVLRVLIERAVCHAASLPVAIALQCWPARRAKAKLVGGRLKVVEP